MLNTNSLDTQAIVLPISPTMQQTAELFAAEQTTAQKRSQIFNNSLAVFVVNTYMKMMEFDTDLSASDSLHPLLRQYSDVADLRLSKMGTLECRPLDPKTHCCILPLDLSEDRIGLVAVELDNEGCQAKLLGFTPTVNPGAVVSLDQLQSLDRMLSFLERYEPKPVHLDLWIEGVFESGWQTIDRLIGNARWNFALGFMNEPFQLQPSVSGAKLVDLGIELGSRQVVLLLAIARLPNQQLNVQVLVHPTEKDKYLPPKLSLSLLSEAGESLRKVCSRRADNIIQLPRFQCSQGEQFGIQICLDDFCLTEVFKL
jgi:hypothetical protein